jgi:hypothetical protein
LEAILAREKIKENDAKNEPQTFVEVRRSCDPGKWPKWQLKLKRQPAVGMNPSACNGHPGM